MKIRSFNKSIIKLPIVIDYYLEGKSFKNIMMKNFLNIKLRPHKKMAVPWESY